MCRITGPTEMLRDEGADGHARVAVRDVVQMGVECLDDSYTVLGGKRRGQQQKHAKRARLTYYPLGTPRTTRGISIPIRPF